MREVTKDEFYRRIYDDGLDLHPTIVSNAYPYTSVFRWRKNPHAEPYGKVVGTIERGVEVNTYFVSSAA